VERALCGGATSSPAGWKVSDGNGEAAAAAAMVASRRPRPPERRLLLPLWLPLWLPLSPLSPPPSQKDRSAAAATGSVGSALHVANS